ncbi:citrinin biosynthesis oxydoreductase CtnB like protein [Zymoseptoria brevis]|uniref:Citrinin biosynthesis oxydoreductase CtnB like protein n=1 Tax=Zymoseptoria brevis TaxID=1047168 RepID=A0A0F4GCD8_9PEZI|nr:citrinin biosynthesis oxydoreductase CtnB like protein [Zymoseptoria brevis]
MSYSRPQSANQESNLHKPRILCLHGGGVTGEVFQLQARAFIHRLADFRLVFADGPHFCDAGPGIAPTYTDFGPFRRWLRWLETHQELDDEVATEELMYAIDTCKQNDPGDGPWVGVLGFSQGAKVASSLLYDQQIRLEKEGAADTDYKFGVICNGRLPLVSLCKHSRSPALVNPGGMSEGFKWEGVSPHVLKIPTIHVHGLKDPGIHLHREMLEKYHDPDTATVIEWNGEHRMPIKAEDVEPIVRAIYRIAVQENVLL